MFISYKLHADMLHSKAMNVATKREATKVLRELGNNPDVHPDTISATWHGGKGYWDNANKKVVWLSMWDLI